MRYCIILFLGLLFMHGLYAQENNPVDGTFEESSVDTAELFSYPPVDPREVWKKNGYDSERVDVKRFDVKKWKEVVGKIDYQEGADRAEDGSSPETSAESGDFNGKLSVNIPIPPMVLKISFYTLIFGVIGYLLWMVVKDTSLKAKPKVLKKESADPTQQVADIKELEVDRLLQDAMVSGNYPLAIRIYFLGLLKKLDEDGFIIWKKDKTNRDYLAELFSKKHYFDEVKSLTLAYEAVWYGGHHFPIAAYEKIISSFKTIHQKLNASKTSAA